MVKIGGDVRGRLAKRQARLAKRMAKGTFLSPHGPHKKFFRGQ